MDWIPSDGTTLHAVDLRSGATKRFRAPAFFVFHWANAFHSEGGRCARGTGSLRAVPWGIAYCRPPRAAPMLFSAVSAGEQASRGQSSL